MKITSFLAFSSLLLSIQAVKYFRGNQLYSSDISNPNLLSIPDTTDSNEFAVDNTLPGYYDSNSQNNNNFMARSNLGGDLGNAGMDNFFSNDYNDVDPNLGRLAPANGIGSYYGGGLLYPNLYMLTLGNQNYGNSGGLNTAYNFNNNDGQFAVDNSGADLGGQALNGAGSVWNTQGVYGAKSAPQFNGYDNLNGGSYDGGNFYGDGYSGDAGQFIIS